MLILGDLACPSRRCAEKLISDMEKSELFKNKLILCNLEGMIRDDEPYQDEKLFNHLKILDAFETGKTVFSLANNHTYDYPECIASTQHLLTEKGFLNVGICDGEEIKPVRIQSGTVQYAIFAHCWKVYTKTNPNKENDIRVIDSSYKAFSFTVKKYAREHPEERVICYFHWNYDMEMLPFPAHRELAHDLVDAGVFSVIGNHSHVPQGGEMYKGHAIVYGLGNFYIPSGYFFNGKLKYPEESKKMMVLELPEESDIPICHWFQTDCESGIGYLCSESIQNGATIRAYSEYTDLDRDSYAQYFKKNRVKRTLVPVFSHYRGLGYELMEKVAIERIRIIKMIKR